MEKKKFKSGKEIVHLTMLERGTSIEELDKRYQSALRMVNDKNEKFINFNHLPMLILDTRNIITCHNNNSIDTMEFFDRMEKLVGYRIMFEQLNTEDGNSIPT